MPPSIIDFVTDPNCSVRSPPAQVTLRRTIYGLPLKTDQPGLYQQGTGRQAFLGHPFGEVAVIAGACAGKDSRIAALIVCYKALSCGHDPHLARGERGVIPLVAHDIRATRVAFGCAFSPLGTRRSGPSGLTPSCPRLGSRPRSWRGATSSRPRTAPATWLPSIPRERRRCLHAGHRPRQGPRAGRPRSEGSNAPRTEAGWKPMGPLLLVNRCGHGQQFIPWPESDGYWLPVGVWEPDLWAPIGDS